MNKLHSYNNYMNVSEPGHAEAQLHLDQPIKWKSTPPIK